MKIPEYTKVTTLQNGDMFVFEASNGTRIIIAKELARQLLKLMEPTEVLSVVENQLTPEMHRNIFRGKNLGTSVTSTQLANIRNGSFKDLYVGDYWTIGGINWRIVDINYWMRCGDTDFNKPHLVIMPDTNLYSAKMNETNTTVGGYVGSAMYTTNLAQAKTKVNEAFGSAVLTHREYLTNAISNGYPSAGAWYDSSVELPNECMMYGAYVFTPAGNGSIVPNRYTISKSQLALFKLVPRFISNRQWFWLRDVVSASGFARVDGNGCCSCAGASRSSGVRVVFPIG